METFTSIRRFGLHLADAVTALSEDSIGRAVDAQKIADKLILLLRDEELRKGMGEAGRRSAEDNYTFEFPFAPDASIDRGLTRESAESLNVEQEG